MTSSDTARSRSYAYAEGVRFPPPAKRKATHRGMTRLRLTDGIELIIETSVDEARQALQMAIADGQFLEITVADGRFVTINPQHVLYLLEGAETDGDDAPSLNGLHGRVQDRAAR
jgi:hypothetical protein